MNFKYHNFNNNFNNNFYDKLDDDWINKFENIDKLYKDFYKEDLYYINLKFIYINSENEIERLKQETFLMTKPNVITQEEIIQLLKKNSIDNKKRYYLLSILKYNINIEPDDINNYLTNKINNNYLSIIKYIDTINFDKTINMFHDLNDLIFVFYEKIIDIKHNNTKKIYLKNNNNKKTIKHY
jgi:hypothetical protein